MKLEQLTSNVWILPAHPDDDKVQPAVGVVIGKTETVLVDAGNTPRLAQHLYKELQTIQAPPVKQIIYTHHHWDHVFGACVFNAPVTAHVSCKEKLRKFYRDSWSKKVLQELVEHGDIRAESAEIIREGVDDWTTFRLVLPTKTFETTEILEAEGYRLELTHVSSKHSSDSVVVNVLGENVMFVADAFYPAPLRQEPNDRTLDRKVLEFMLESSCTQFVHGHGEVLSRETVQEILNESI